MSTMMKTISKYLRRGIVKKTLSKKRLPKTVPGTVADKKLKQRKQKEKIRTEQAASKARKKSKPRQRDEIAKSRRLLRGQKTKEMYESDFKRRHGGGNPAYPEKVKKSLSEFAKTRKRIRMLENKIDVLTGRRRKQSPRILTDSERWERRNKKLWGKK